MKTFQNYNLSKRTLTGLIYAAVIIAAVFAGKWTFLGLLTVFNAVSSYEYFHIVFNRQKISIFLISGILTNLLIMVLAFLFSLGILPAFPIAVIIAFELALLLFFYQNGWFRNISYLLSGHLWISAPISLFACYSLIDGQYSERFAIVPFILIWVYDVAAYFTGIMLGRHQLAPLLSPLKTREGLLGGILATLAVSFLIPVFFNLSGNFLFWIIMGLSVAIGATAGDLLESAFKREFQLKDSGSFLPGHGGMLDRIDSLLMAIPFYILVNQLFIP